jgi:hypothetical protein
MCQDEICFAGIVNHLHLFKQSQFCKQLNCERLFREISASALQTDSTWLCFCACCCT